MPAFDVCKESRYILMQRGRLFMEKRTVLVVEDNPDNLDLIRYLMETAGYQYILPKMGARPWSRHSSVARFYAAGLDHPGDRRVGSGPAVESRGGHGAYLYHCAHRPRHAGGPQTRPRVGCDAYVTKPLDTPNFVHQVETLLSKA
jgi:CheY-like chemotaxis protein